MRLKNWLLAGTGLGMLAFAAAPAFAQGDIFTYYRAYIAARDAGDQAGMDAAAAAMRPFCAPSGWETADCLLAVETGIFGPMPDPNAAPPPAPVEAPPVEPAPVEPAPVEAPPAVDPMAQLGAELQNLVNAYNGAKAAVEAGDPNQMGPAQNVLIQIENTCVSAGFGGVNECLATFGLAVAPINVPPPPAPVEPAPVEQPPVEQPPQPDPMAQLQGQLTAELGNYQTALDLAAAGDFANAQPMADAAASNILALCTNAGYPSIEACIGQSLPPLPTPQRGGPVEAPPVEPTPVAPPPEQPPAVDPNAQLNAALLEQVQIYGAALSAVETGNPNQYPAAQNAYAQIQNICFSAGFGDVNSCLAQFGYAVAPLPPPPTVTDTPTAQPVEQPPVVIPEQLLDQDVTPDAVETLPADILPEEAAPLLDSIKDALGIGGQPIELPPAEPMAPPPTSDADAQAFAPIELPPVDAETGEAIQAPFQLGVQQSPDAQITQQQNGGFVIELNTGLYFDNPEQERDRIWDQAEDEIFYERLSRGRIKETIVRPNGVQIVTIRDRDGDVLRRSRITPDGREYVLAYYDEEDDFTEYQDPGEDLPPLILNIPARDYVLDARDVDDAEVADFFSQPPVEQVRRIYSIEEVKRSARIRDSVRRLEIGGLTFDSGKATISRSQVGALSNVANAMLFLLDRNPAETFLIEGHTDAVGSEISNLGLSDLRASTIARILTDFYDIPPENLVTQGYGERYLKVRTLEAERLNRRVTVRRITPLITLASN